MQTDAFMMNGNNKTVTIAVAGTTATTLIPGNGEFLCITNTAALAGIIIYVETCEKANPIAAVVATSMPILAGETRVIRRRPGHDAISTIGSAAGPTNLCVTPGTGNW